jgi:hypothetical protein
LPPAVRDGRRTAGASADAAARFGRGADGRASPVEVADTDGLRGGGSAVAAATTGGAATATAAAGGAAAGSPAGLGGLGAAGFVKVNFFRDGDSVRTTGWLSRGVVESGVEAALSQRPRGITACDAQLDGLTPAASRAHL